jgi:hypothetical protein
MSVAYLRAGAARGDVEKVTRFVRLHLSDGNEAIARKRSTAHGSRL